MAAVYAAGVFDLERAIEVVLRRGQVMASTAGPGAMAVVGMPAAAVEELIGRYGLPLSVAAINSPVNTVIAGDRAVIAEFEPVARDGGAFWSVLPGDYAFHSPHMLPVRDELIAAIGQLSPRPAALPVFSTVTGELAAPDAFDARYWADNVVRPVQFAAALHAATVEDAHNLVVEVGPHAVLTTSISQALQDRGSGLTTLTSMRAGRDSRETMLDAVGGLYVLGRELHHPGLYPAGGRRVDLPHYPWQRERYWLPARPTSSAAIAAAAGPDTRTAIGAGGAERDRAASDTGDDRLLSRLRAASTARARIRLLEDVVQAEVAAVLGRPAGTRLDREIGFFDAGMDSITSMELKGRLEAVVGQEISATAAFEHPTIPALTGYIFEDILRLPDPDLPELTPDNGRAAPGGRPHAVLVAGVGMDEPATELMDERIDRLAAELEQLSEDELIKLLNEELEGDREHS
jgi:acyl transferase domain-containing protein